MNIPKQPFNQKFLKYLITVLIVIGSIWSASGLEITPDRFLSAPGKIWILVSAMFPLDLSQEAIDRIVPKVAESLFIAWAGKTEMPVFFLTMLAVLSYLGGIISFFIGKGISKMPSVYNYLEVKMEKHVKMIRKWGGFLIVVGALLPIPFSITSIAAGLIHYKFSNYLLFGLLRFVRFYLYALVIFNIV